MAAAMPIVFIVDDDKVVHETQYYRDPFEAPAWRRQWVQQIA